MRRLIQSLPRVPLARAVVDLTRAFLLPFPVRVRLQPPEFGELDVRLVVENGNQLNLTIAAERADMTQLLQRHLDELKHSLQAAGLDVAGASVHTRGEGSRDGARDQRGQGGVFAGDTDEQAAATTTPRLGGYVSAEGLDFWA